MFFPCHQWLHHIQYCGPVSNNARMMSYENPVWALLLCLTYFSKSAFCAREQRAYNIISFRLMMSVEKKEQQMKEKVLDDSS